MISILRASQLQISCRWLLATALLVVVSCGRQTRNTQSPHTHQVTDPSTPPLGPGVSDETTPDRISQSSPPTQSANVPKKRVSSPASDPFGAERAARARRCIATSSSQKIPLYGAGAVGAPKVSPDPDFVSIRETLRSACAGCHLAPGANAGHFSYLDSYEQKTVFANGREQTFPGLVESAERIRDSVVNQRMPPAVLRNANPKLYDQLGEQLSRWISRQMPAEQEQSVALPSELQQILGLTEPQGFTDLGDCLPVLDPTNKGKIDSTKDDFFAKSNELPEDLKETDFISFDADVLARHGTYAYNVEYPLWTDNLAKSRLVHVPSVDRGGGKVPVPIRFDLETRQFLIPDNTRFYKTFYRAVALNDGNLEYRPIETRLIVVRHPPANPLYGTYVWSDDGTKAKLLTAPYRDGTSWKDLVFDVTTDEKTNQKRKYAVPARHRCDQCHKGGDDQSFILGFTPIQINRRNAGEAGRVDHPSSDELAQVDRLLALGVLTGIDASHKLPKLEETVNEVKPSEWTLRAQGYMLGNCAHCHNPNGFAMKDNKVTLNLAAGELFKFNTNAHSINSSTKKFVDHNGNLDSSYLYKRISASREELGLESQMPLHSPGGPDCYGLTVIGQWIRSYDKNLTPEALANFKPATPCTPRNAVNSGNFTWVTEDFTSVPGPYAPRRLDWANEQTGMPPRYRQMRFDGALQKLVNRPTPVDFWRPDEACDFSKNRNLNARDVRPWMKKPDGSLKQPLNQVYYATPGGWFFNSTCSVCHGRYAKGDGVIGQAITRWSGGDVTVANFADGMFGGDGDNKGQNLRLFDVSKSWGRTTNLAPNYLIWMAMEGTRVNLPDAAAQYLGPHKTQMLRQVRERCGWLIPTSPVTLTARMNTYEIFRDVCTYGNTPVTAPELQYRADNGQPSNPAALEAWLDRAATNAGYAIYEYLRTATKTGKWLSTQGECRTGLP